MCEGPVTSCDKEWVTGKGDADNGRQLRRIWDNAETKIEVTSDQA
jgi:hypothetical protein